MFERFTDRARRVVVLAQEEARLLNHQHIGTEHILLGLIHEAEGVAAQALESMGLALESVRAEVVQAAGEGRKAPSGHIPFTRRAKKALELSLREALQFGHNYIGTEHILLGLVREGEGGAAKVLVKLGADLSQVRQRVIQLLSGYAGEPVAPGHAVTGAGFGPESSAVLLNPGVLVAPGEPPTLRRVVALGETIQDRGGRWLAPISLTIWSTFVELRYAAGGGQGQPTVVSPDQWAVEDDLGTDYSYAGTAVNAYGALLLGAICFTPPPPEGASRFSLLGPTGLRLDVELSSVPTGSDIGAVGEAARPAAPDAGDEGIGDEGTGETGEKDEGDASGPRPGEAV